MVLLFLSQFGKYGAGNSHGYPQLIGFYYEGITGSLPRSLTGVQIINVPPSTILVLDDEPFIRMNLAIFLEDEGYNVLEAATAEQALHLLETHDVALAIVDLRLPGIDGSSFIRYAKLKDTSLQFMIHTGSLEYRIEESLLRLGLTASDIFCKPIKDMAQLSQAIAKRVIPRLDFV